MKRTLFCIFSALSFVTAQATVSVNWNSGANSIKDVTNVNAPATWIAQLIWSPDSAVSAIDPSNPFVPTDGESVYFQQQLNGSSIAGRILSGQRDNTNNALAGGFVYTRVFNVDFNGGSPSTPTLFGNSSVISGPLLVVDADPTNGIEIITHTPATSTNLLTVNQAIVIVPEPSTYAFFGVGALALARRLRKR